MVVENQLKRDVNLWICDAFKKKNFKKFDAEITGSSEIGDGYVGDIVFVKLKAVASNDEIRNFDLVLKYGKQIASLREQLPVRLAFEREIFVYSKTVPTFQQFEEDKNVKVLDKLLPQCFNTLLYEKQEVLVLQNLKAIGYDLHDRYQPLDLNHLKLTFDTYGRWHAFSMAFRDQKPEEYSAIFGNLESVMEAFMSSSKDILEKAEEGLYSILESNNEFTLMKRLRERFQTGFKESFYKLVKINEGNSVLLHGDCWNNNIMFKYDKQHNEQPETAVLLDFQVSTLGLPVLDLSHHFYSTSSEKELLEFKELLGIYHSSVSSTLKKLGSDPEQLFPYSELVRLWRKYSSYGIIMASILLPITLSDKDDHLDIQDVNGDKFKEILGKAMQKNSNICLRLIAVVKHFLNFDDF